MDVSSDVDSTCVMDVSSDVDSTCVMDVRGDVDSTGVTDVSSDVDFTCVMDVISDVDFTCVMDVSSLMTWIPRHQRLCVATSPLKETSYVVCPTALYIRLHHREGVFLDC